MREQLIQALESRDHTDKHLQQLKLEFGFREQRLRVEMEMHITHTMAFPPSPPLKARSNDVLLTCLLLGLKTSRKRWIGACACLQEAIYRSKVGSTPLSQAKVIALIGTDQEFAVLPRRPHSSR